MLSYDEYVTQNMLLIWWRHHDIVHSSFIRDQHKLPNTVHWHCNALHFLKKSHQQIPHACETVCWLLLVQIVIYVRHRLLHCCMQYFTCYFISDHVITISGYSWTCSPVHNRALGRKRPRAILKAFINSPPPPPCATYMRQWIGSDCFR